jgi:hypothetical protein
MTGYAVIIENSEELALPCDDGHTCCLVAATLVTYDSIQVDYCVYIRFGRRVWICLFLRALSMRGKIDK